MRPIVLVWLLIGTPLRAQSLPGDSCAGAADALWRALDLSALGQAQLELERAVVFFESTDFWHRLVPRITLSASFGISGLAFIEDSDRGPLLVPNDQYRLTFSLSLTDLFFSTEHEKARLMKEQALLDVRLKQTRQLMERQLLVERAGRLRAELALVEEELRLTERIHRFYEALFEQGKTGFDTVIRAELRAIEVRQKLQELRSELSVQSVN